MKYFVYCRKSSEDKHRQVLSIESQMREVHRTFSTREGIEIVAVFEEERSAMKPGRPVFAQMMSRIEKGEASGIIAWAPDRLARNSIDGGRIVYLLDCNILLDLKFSTYTFENNSQGKFMLQIMFGQSKYYSDALSENVRRGVRTKVENGWWPTIAPIGYLNERQSGTIARDPARFYLVQQLLHAMLTGAYSGEELLQKATAWGLTTPKRRQLGGKPLVLSTIYKMLHNPFYAGILAWNGKWYQGKHEPMISVQEHERIVALLDAPGRPQPKTYYFAYTGLIRCGACGFSVTAEKKRNRHGSQYVYYHCSRRGRPTCREKYIEVGELEKQLKSFLSSISISPEIAQWAIPLLEAELSQRRQAEDRRLDAVSRSIATAEARMLELAEMRANRLIGDSEYLKLREKSSREMMAHQSALATYRNAPSDWSEPASVLLGFTANLSARFGVATEEHKRLIVSAVCSNLTLKDKILSIEARNPYHRIPRIRNIPKLRAFVEYIRTLSGTKELQAAIDPIKVLQAQEGQQSILSNVPDVPTSPDQEAA